MSVVRIIEGPYYRGYFYKEYMGIFPGPSELSVLESLRRASTVPDKWTRRIHFVYGMGRYRNDAALLLQVGV